MALKEKESDEILSLFTSVIMHIFSDCLQRFVDVEELADTERYMCPKCNKKQPSTKKYWLTSLSNVSFP